MTDEEKRIAAHKLEQRMMYERQMKAWAIDRALETLKHNKNVDGLEIEEQVMQIASKYVEYIFESPDFDPTDPTDVALEVEAMKHDA